MKANLRVTAYHLSAKRRHRNCCKSLSSPYKSYLTITAINHSDSLSVFPTFLCHFSSTIKQSTLHIWLTRLHWYTCGKLYISVLIIEREIKRLEEFKTVLPLTVGLLSTAQWFSANQAQKRLACTRSLSWDQPWWSLF